ncbi:BAG domain-containing protein Samui isoform X1 [Drosophila novamexicana]|uniref:BAG domain-containing protein Samui isoform X1 n=2 Tax=Drosophila novamexicana TaxID=47314 RepID=UPI0011E5C12E|nr:BAG domain-containing protein Samui isoform X1 [Drosophila novamexicana]
MKPTVIAASQPGAGGGGGNGNGTPAGPGINIPISREYVGSGASPQQQQHPQHYAQQQQPAQFYASQPAAYGSPRQQQQPQVPINPQQQHFQQAFGFEPDMDMDMDNMFPRSRLGRLHNDPFAGFGGTRKRNSLHDPHTHNYPQAHSMHADDDFSHYFDDAADFGFPQFSTLGRRGRVAGGANSHMEPDDDFFNRLPSDFRQYIPEGFSGRRSAGGGPPQPRPQQQYYQQDFSVPQQTGQAQATHAPQSPSKRLCDAAIQTDDPAGRSEVDCAPPVNLNQHGLRNTMDMGVKSVTEQEQGPRSHSAPPPEQQQLNQQYQQQQTNQQRPTPPPQFGTQTSPPVQPNFGTGQPQPPQFHKTYYPPQQQAHPQQKQQTPPPPQTPGGSNVRTIPIFVEGRTEPIINAHKEIPNQSAAAGQAHAQAQASAQAYYAPQQQQHQQQRPAPVNTQQPQGDPQLQTDAGVGVPPQTPHTVDSIKKIQDIQRDVLDLMAKVEQFKGTRNDKEYVYLDEMLTRNLLKLDTIDTNGKDSIRLARKEAIKCIQASVNVLDAKAEENARRASGTVENAAASTETEEPRLAEQAEPAAVAEPATPQPLDATKIQDPIPLPPPPSAAEGAENVPDSQAAIDNSQPSTETTKSETTTLTQSSE